MRHAATRRIRLGVLVGTTASLFGPLSLVVTDVPSVDLARFTILIVAIAASFGVVTWLAAAVQPNNKVVWILALFVVGVGTVGLAQFVMANVSPEISLPLDNETQIPAELDPLVAWTEGVGNAIGSLAMTSLLTFGLLLFPDGHLPSTRWRPVALIFVLGVVGSAVTNVTAWMPSNTVAPFGEDGQGHQSFSSGVLAIFALVGPLISLGALVGRFRRSDPTDRARIKWIIWGSTVLIPAAIIGSISGITYVTVIGVLTFVAAYGIAIVRHRLYDIDLVISRSLVFGALAVFIGVVYVAVVVGIGTLFGAGDEPNAGLAIGATTLVAVSFQPLRHRFERVANRIVFGRRATPYEVLSDFSQRVAATDESLLVDAARGLVDGTAAERVVISVAIAGRMVPTAEWPSTNGRTDQETTSFPIRHDEAELGELTLLCPRGLTLPEADHRLATEMASAMGLALRNQTLTETLQARVDQLRESRQRLVAVQDETRRKLERDLHDGAQQQLVALKVKLGLARQLAEKEGAGRSADMLVQITGEADAAVDAMRDFARGVYPPLLEAEGLVSAIRSQARRAPMPVEVMDEGVGRYPREVESTIYFCVLEALQNTAKYADAGTVTVTLAEDDGEVSFSVADDGVGFDPITVTRGTGLTNMEDRLGAVGGTITIVSGRGEGTAVTGRVPAGRHAVGSHS